MIVKMGSFTPEWTQNFVCCVFGLLFKVLNCFVVVRHCLWLLTKVTVVSILKKTSSCYEEIYHVLAAQFSAMSVFGPFFVSSSPPFKLKSTYVSLRNYFIQCQLNPVPTSVPF